MSAYTAPPPSNTEGRAPFAWEQPDSGAWALPASSSGTQPATGSWDGAQANGWEQPTPHGQDAQASTPQGWNQPPTLDTKPLSEAPAPHPQTQDGLSLPGGDEQPTARGWEQPAAVDGDGAPPVADGWGQQQSGWTAQMASALPPAALEAQPSDQDAHQASVPNDGDAQAAAPPPAYDTQNTAPAPVQNGLPSPPGQSPPLQDATAQQRALPAASPPVLLEKAAVQQPVQPGPSPPVPNWPPELNGLFLGDSNGDPALRLSPDRINELEQIEFKVRGTGDRTESWDERLTNPETLCDWLRLQACRPPKVELRILGCHTETRTVRTTTHTENGVRYGTRTERYVVTDFTFDIPLQEVYTHDYGTNSINRANILLQVANVNQIPEPKAEGTHWWNDSDSSSSSSSSDDDKTKHKTAANEGHKARKRARIKQFFGISDSSSSDDEGDKRDDEEKKNDKDKKDAKGTTGTTTAGPDSKPKPAQIDTSNDDAPKALVHTYSPSMDTRAALLQWCTAFCADPQRNKCLILSKRTWGWDFERINKRINEVIKTTGYPHRSSLVWSFNESYVVVRPPSRSLRVLQRMTSKGSVQYIAAQSCFAMNIYPPLPGTYQGETLDQARTRLPNLRGANLPANPKTEYGPQGVHYLLGEREADWLANWLPRIDSGIKAARWR